MTSWCYHASLWCARKHTRKFRVMSGTRSDGPGPALAPDFFFHAGDELVEALAGHRRRAHGVQARRFAGAILDEIRLVQHQHPWRSLQAEIGEHPIDRLDMRAPARIRAVHDVQ